MALKIVGGAFVLVREKVNAFTLVPQNSSRTRGFHQVPAAKRPSDRRNPNPAMGHGMCCANVLPPPQFLPPDRSAGHRDADRRAADRRLQPRVLGPPVAAAHGRAERQADARRRRADARASRAPADGCGPAAPITSHEEIAPVREWEKGEGREAAKDQAAIKLAERRRSRRRLRAAAARAGGARAPRRCAQTPRRGRESCARSRTPSRDASGRAAACRHAVASEVRPVSAGADRAADGRVTAPVMVPAARRRAAAGRGCGSRSSQAPPCRGEPPMVTVPDRPRTRRSRPESAAVRAAQRRRRRRRRARSARSSTRSSRRPGSPARASSARRSKPSATTSCRASGSSAPPRRPQKRATHVEASVVSGSD